MKALLVYHTGALLVQEMNYYPDKIFLPTRPVPSPMMIEYSPDLTYDGGIVKFTLTGKVGPYMVYEEDK